MLSDDELYRRYLAGNAAAGDQLMLGLSKALTSYLNAFLHNMEDAEDLMLECFAVILVDKPKISEGHFRAYLFRMARLKANSLWRRKLRHVEFVLEEDVASTDDTPEDFAVKSDRDSIVQRCLNRIAPQYREALWLIYGLNMNYANAAAVLRCNNKRIDNLLMNGKKQMRKELEKEGVTSAILN